jgi:hypothetical protein
MDWVEMVTNVFRRIVLELIASSRVVQLKRVIGCTYNFLSRQASSYLEHNRSWEKQAYNTNPSHPGPREMIPGNRRVIILMPEKETRPIFVSECPEHLERRPNA